MGLFDRLKASFGYGGDQSSRKALSYLITSKSLNPASVVKLYQQKAQGMGYDQMLQGLKDEDYIKRGPQQINPQRAAELEQRQKEFTSKGEQSKGLYNSIIDRLSNTTGDINQVVQGMPTTMFGGIDQAPQVRQNFLFERLPQREQNMLTDIYKPGYGDVSKAPELLPSLYATPKTAIPMTVYQEDISKDRKAKLEFDKLKFDLERNKAQQEFDRKIKFDKLKFDWERNKAQQEFDRKIKEDYIKRGPQQINPQRAAELEQRQKEFTSKGEQSKGLYNSIIDRLSNTTGDINQVVQGMPTTMFGGIDQAPQVRQNFLFERLPQREQNMLTDIYKPGYGDVSKAPELLPSLYATPKTAIPMTVYQEDISKDRKAKLEFDKLKFDWERNKAQQEFDRKIKDVDPVIQRKLADYAINIQNDINKATSDLEYQRDQAILLASIESDPEKKRKNIEKVDKMFNTKIDQKRKEYLDSYSRAIKSLGSEPEKYLGKQQKEPEQKSEIKLPDNIIPWIEKLQKRSR